ncbi:MAG TPA: hypothetical protein VJ276_26305 [Thermoanaerobaculia bacterium]|nr:hypothetical protein [Thermoanaerobaculia bacterium]
MRPLLVAFLIASATRALAGYASRDAWLPIAGRAVGQDGRVFGTTIWLTNVSSDAARVTLSFSKSSQPNPTPHVTALTLAPGASRVIDDLGVEGVGALHIESTEDVVAHARVYSQLAGEEPTRSTATSFNAVPAQFAVGNGETATLQGGALAPGFRYRLWLVETTGNPLYYELTLLDTAGRPLSRKRLYLGGREPRMIDVGEILPSTRADQLLIRIAGVNGNGRLIATASLIATGSGDGTAYEMTLATAPRTGFSTAELVAYGAVALALLAAAIPRRRARPLLRLVDTLTKRRAA